MKDDLIHQYCKGEGERFNGKRCESYLDSDECRLLKEEDLTEIFERGRCEPSKMIEQAVKANLLKYLDKVMIEEHLGAVSFETRYRIVKQTRLKKGYTLPVLQGYIKIAARHNVRKTLEEEGVLQKYECGKCIHLSESKPSFCQRETIVTEAGEIENPALNQKRNPSDPACKKGFEPFTFENFDKLPDLPSDPVDVPVEQIIERAEDLLNKRAGHEKKPVEKKCYKRQHLLFCKYIQDQSLKEAEWKKKMAKELGIGEKTIQRDWNAIIKYLKSEFGKGETEEKKQTNDVL